MAGVTTLNSDFQNVVTLAAGATEVAAASNGNSLVAYRPVSGGHTTVGVTAYVGAASAQSGHWGRVIVNAGNWLGCGPTPTPTATPTPTPTASPTATPTATPTPSRLLHQRRLLQQRPHRLQPLQRHQRRPLQLPHPMTLTTITDQTSCSITGARAKRLSGTCTTTFLPAGAFGPILPAGWNLIDVADFNRDGNNDYALFNSSTRQTAIWYLSGNMIVGERLGSDSSRAAGHWLRRVILTADGKPDFVLYKPSTGQTGVWYLNNNVFAGGGYGPTLPAGWRIAGVADFNGNGQTDYAPL